MVWITVRSWYGRRSFVVCVSHSPLRILISFGGMRRTQWFAVRMTCGWIRLPPHRHASSAIRISATVHGNSPNPASFCFGKDEEDYTFCFWDYAFGFTVFPASWKSSPPTLRMPHPLGVSGRLVTDGGLAGSWRTCASTQHTSSTSWHSLGLNRISIMPNPSNCPSVLIVFVLGSHK